jgi:hypothetical protein
MEHELNGASAQLTRIQLALAGLALLASAGWLLNATLRDPNVPFLTRAGDPPWISVAMQPDANAIRVDTANPPTVTFVARFALEAVPAEAELRGRALTRAELLVNDEPIPGASGGDETWKQPFRVRVESALETGPNEVRVRVTNARGPALLKLRLRDAATGDVLLETNATWDAYGPDGRAAGTQEASDTRPHPQSFSMKSAGQILVERAGVLALLFTLGALLHLVAGRILPAAVRSRPAEVVLCAATLFWLAVYFGKTSQLPVLMGFDIVGHLAYIDYLLEERAIPLATEGWSMYHPPLAHFATSLLVGTFDVAPESSAARWLYRLPTVLAGLGNVWATYFVARRLFASDPLRTSLATGFAALLPMNVYMSAYVSNEPVHSFLVSLSLLLATNTLLRSGVDAKQVASVAVAVGLAITAKFTALIAVPVTAVCIGLKAWLADGLRGGRALGTAAALLAGVTLVGGWVYARNWLLLGRPVVGNWDLPGNLVWWEQPGFHTLAYYAGFGQALTHPFFAGYHSFWDGLYSTFWGDGLAAGMIRLSTRHGAWSYDFMTAGYWLAFPATVLLVLGVGRGLSRCLRGDDPRARLAMTLHMTFLYCVSFALLAITLRLPYYAQAKAFYVLCAIVPLSIAAALGLAWLPERLTGPRWLAVRMLFSGWLTTLAGAIILSFLG